MQYRVFGKTGHRVSILGFGAMRLPQRADNTCDLERSVPLLRRGMDLGINYLDSAHVYIEGTSEVAVGQAIKGYDRAGLYLATKIQVNTEEEAGAASYRRRLEESLRRFDTPYVDFALFHGLRWGTFESLVSRRGMALDAARKAQSEGLIRHICFSSHDTPQNIIRLVDTGEFAAVLMQYNFLYRHNEPAIARAAVQGLGVAIMGPIAGGRLAIPQGVLRAADGTRTARTPELALRYVWSNPDVGVALSGMNTLEQIEENAAAANQMARMSAAEIAEVNRLAEENRRLADLYCTGCGYCQPCPNGVNIPENFRYMNWHRVWGLTEAARKAYAALGPEGTWGPWAGRITGLRASECLECGECEPKCPQNIPIMAQLKDVAKTLGEE
ncbi:MAG: aldo/keto reductase [Chloroflexota bacterium]|nr:aldo/keto reductase [Chloroflexota bacterium]